MFNTSFQSHEIAITTWRSKPSEAFYQRIINAVEVSYPGHARYAQWQVCGGEGECGQRVVTSVDQILDQEYRWLVEHMRR